MKIFRGKVVGVKNKKTAIVEVERFFAHPLYLKRTRKTKRYPVHDETGVKEGNIVDFAQTRPISKTKRWKIVEVIGKEKARLPAPERSDGGQISEVSSASPEATADRQLLKAKKGENQRKSARKSAKNQRLATERSQR